MVNNVSLTRAQQSLLRSLYTRHGRKKSGLCVAEGVRSVGEMCAAIPDAIEFFVCLPGVRPPVDCAPVYEVSESVFSAISATVHGQGLLAVARIPAPPDAALQPRDPYLLALDKVGDPGNFGTICRTAKASGLNELWLTAGSVDPYGDKAVRSALGAQFSMQIRFFPDLAALAEAARKFGYGPVWLTDPHQGENLYHVPELYQKTVLVIGSEGDGVSDLAGANRVTIPMPGKFESLNAAQAATIFLFEAVRRNFS